MDIRRFTPDDAETVAAVVALDNAVNAVDAPFLHPMTSSVLTGMLRHGWDGEVPVTYAAWESDRLVGRVTVHTSEWDNLHLAWTGVCVHPELRRAGRGSELLGFAEDRVRELGRTSIGCDGWDLPSTHGFAEVARGRIEMVGVPERQWSPSVPTDKGDLSRNLIELVEVESDVEDAVLEVVGGFDATVSNDALEEVRSHAASSELADPMRSATSKPDRQPSSWNPYPRWAPAYQVRRRPWRCASAV